MLRELCLLLIAGCIGFMTGSLLNRVIDRLPKVLEDDQPPSSTTGVPMVVRYRLVQICSGLLWVLITYFLGASLSAGVYLAAGLILITLFFIDLESFLLPDYLTLSLLWLGLLGSAVGLLPTALPAAVYGAAFGYLLPWSFNTVYKLVRGHDGLGGGDFKLLAALGAWAGWMAVIPVLAAASAIGLLTVLIGCLIKGTKPSGLQMLPFGPFLIIAGIVVVILQQ